MLNKIFFASLVAAMTLFSSGALATNCSTSNPNTYSTISNGTTADAIPVMANFDYLLFCANTNLAPLADPNFGGKVGVGVASPIYRLQVQNLGGSQLSAAFSTSDFALGSAGSALAISSGATTGDTYFQLQGYTAGGASGNGNIVLAPSGGSVGIGTPSPLAIVDARSPTGGFVLSNTSSTAVGQTAMLSLNPGGAFLNSTYWNKGPAVAGIFESTSSASGLAFYTYSGTQNEIMRISAGGNGGIGTASPATALHVVGTIRQTSCTTAGTLSANASGDIICTSDARLKNILGDYTTGLDALLRITPKLFTYRTTAHNPVETFVHAGFIAQNVMAVIPQASARQRDGYYSLDTTAVLAAGCECHQGAEGRKRSAGGGDRESEGAPRPSGNAYRQPLTPLLTVRLSTTKSPSPSRLMSPAPAARLPNAEVGPSGPTIRVAAALEKPVALPHRT